MWSKTQDSSTCHKSPVIHSWFTGVYALKTPYMQYQIFEAINSPGFLPMNCSVKVALYLVNLKSLQSLQEVSYC